MDTPEIRGSQAWVFRSGLLGQILAPSKVVDERKIRVLVVDNNPLVRDGISLLIGLDAGMELTGSVSSATQAVVQFAQCRPDVTLMDLDLPSGEGIEAIQQILKLDAAACIVGLHTYEWEPARSRALRAGVRACLEKDRLKDELVALIREAAAVRGTGPDG
jgi:DNA-binding NarL/FixJ family response regulator